MTVRVAVAAGLLIFIVSTLTSQLLLRSLYREQEEGLSRLADVYLDGLSAAVYPAVVDEDAERAERIMERAMWFHRGIRELRISVQLPDGQQFATAKLTELEDAGEAKPPPTEVLDAVQAAASNGFLLSAGAATGWAYRSLKRHGPSRGVLLAELDLRHLKEKRTRLRLTLLSTSLALSSLAAMGGYIVMAWMLRPVRYLVRHLEQARRGELGRIMAQDLPPPTTEFGRLLRAFNAMVEDVEQHRALAAQLAERDKAGVLGRLAATIAHEVRNPLAGMSNAVDTVRKFGNDRAIRERNLALIERGLWSIRDVVGSVLTIYRVPAGRRLEVDDLEDVRLLTESEARRQGVRLSWSNRLDRPVDLGATEIRQIALNLVLNACAASPKGAVVRFAAEMRTDPHPLLHLLVEDDGPGISPSAAGILTGAPAGSRLPLQTAGMGLKVVRDLVTALGGTIEIGAGATSGGTSIRVNLPVRGRDREPSHGERADSV